METRESTVCLEITSNYIKFAIGSLVGDEPALLYYGEKSIRGCIKEGSIVDMNGVKTAVSSFLSGADESMKVKLGNGMVSIILPPLGLKIYQSNHQTNVVAPNGFIDRIDVVNATNLVMKDAIPTGNATVDIVPDLFMIDGKRAFENPPMGEKSNTLALCAKIHTLPELVLSSYRSAVEGGGFRVIRSSVAPYCASQLIKTDKEAPGTYILVDIGAHITSVSFVGKGTLYSSIVFPKGGDDLTESISSALSIPFDEAERIKKQYGYEERLTEFRSPIALSKDDETGKVVQIFQKDLNNVISTFLESYSTILKNAIEQTVAKQGNSASLHSLPILFVGGGSELAGLNTLFANAFGTHPLTFYTPKVLGGRFGGAVNVLGLIASSGKFRGALSDNYRGVGGLSRDR